MHLHINPHEEAPVYRQIQRQIARAIADHEIRPGDLLESQQDLAVQLAVSPTAVQKAYDQLQSDGLCDQSLGGRFRVATQDLATRRGVSTDLALSLLKRELLNEELRSAREAQRRLLPPTELTSDSWSLSCRCYPAGALAGDFYEVVQHSSGVLDIVIADVAGKGLAAGLIMATTKSLIPLAASHSSPGDAVCELNERLVPVLSNREFVALAFVRFDPRDGTVQLANAGLPDPYLLRHLKPVQTLSAKGDRLPLGIRPEVSYSTLTTSLQGSDRLLLLTDGIPEAIDGEGNPLGYRALGELLNERRDGDADRLAESPGDWLDRFLARVSQRTSSILDDDWTAVLLESRQIQRETTCRS